MEEDLHTTDPFSERIIFNGSSYKSIGLQKLAQERSGVISWDVNYQAFQIKDIEFKITDFKQFVHTEMTCWVEFVSVRLDSL